MELRQTKAIHYYLIDDKHGAFIVRGKKPDYLFEFGQKVDENYYRYFLIQTPALNYQSPLFTDDTSEYAMQVKILRKCGQEIHWFKEAEKVRYYMRCVMDAVKRNIVNKKQKELFV